eukprot:7308243-Prymnesium_polylepis.2
MLYMPTHTETPSTRKHEQRVRRSAPPHTSHPASHLQEHERDSERGSLRRQPAKARTWQASKAMWSVHTPTHMVGT